MVMMAFVLPVQRGMCQVCCRGHGRSWTCHGHRLPKHGQHEDDGDAEATHRRSVSAGAGPWAGSVCWRAAQPGILHRRLRPKRWSMPVAVLGVVMAVRVFVVKALMGVRVAM